MKIGTMRILGGAVAALLVASVPATAQPSGTFNTEMLALSLTGQGQNGPISITLTPNTHSTGQTTVAADGTPGDLTPGNGQATVIESFFDIFFDITSTPMGGLPATHSYTAPNVHILAPYENPPMLPPLPPGTLYEGHLIFSVEDRLAVAAMHAPHPETAQFLPGIPGFAFLESFDSTLFIQCQDGFVYTLNGQTVVGVVPGPGAMALLGLGGLVTMRRRR